MLRRPFPNCPQFPGSEPRAAPAAAAAGLYCPDAAPGRLRALERMCWGTRLARDSRRPGSPAVKWFG